MISAKELLDILEDAECACFYFKNANTSIKEAAEVHKEVRAAFEKLYHAIKRIEQQEE